MSAGSASFTAYPDHAPIQWRIWTSDDTDEIGLYGEVKGAGSLGFLAGPAHILRELDAARQLVIDHLVATVGIPADPTGELLGDILREIGTELPSPLAHRIRSTIAGDQPQPTRRTTASALADLGFPVAAGGAS